MAAPLLQSIGAVAVSANAKCCKKPAASEQSNVMRKVVAVTSLMTVAGCQLYFREGEPDAKAVPDGKAADALPASVECLGSNDRTTTVTFTAEADASIIGGTPLGQAPRLQAGMGHAMLLRFPIVASHVKAFALTLTPMKQDSNTGTVGCSPLAPMKGTVDLRGMTAKWDESKVQANSDGNMSWAILGFPSASVTAQIVTKDYLGTEPLRFGVSVSDQSRIIGLLSALGLQSQNLALMVVPSNVMTAGTFQSRETPVCDTEISPPKITAEVCY